MPSTQTNSLEFRLFRMACAMSIFVSLVLFFIDTFVAKEYDSSIVGLFSLANFSFFYYQAKVKGRFERLLTPFIIILIIIINVAWFTGGGLNITNAFIFLLLLLLTIILAPVSIRSFYIVLIFVNLVVFLALEFLYPSYSQPEIKTNELLVVNTIVLFMVFSIATYVMIFFKNQYDVERDLVKQQNLKLDSSNSEIEAQNEELIQYQEEVMAQRDFIEEKSKKLEEQAIELERANEIIKGINASLEKTVEERTKKLVDLNNDLDLLVYRSSHDFRRPLTTLMGLNEVARLTVKDKVSQELFKKVNKTALNMDKMLLKFFMLYDINHFRTTYEGDTLEEIIDKLDKTMISRKRNIIFNHTFKTSTYSPRDERNSLIEIILENLVENSLIYNSKERIIINQEIIEQDGNLHIIQHDNGNGIPISYHNKVFDMYFRGSTLSTGNGLGLYVVKRAVNLLHATINLDSKEGEYTKVEIVFKV